VVTRRFRSRLARKYRDPGVDKTDSRMAPFGVRCGEEYGGWYVEVEVVAGGVSGCGKRASAVGDSAIGEHG
jgi:hypothetical protein